VRYSPDGSLLAVLGAGKSLELFSVRAAEEARKKLKRRKKRKREKAGKVRGACLWGPGLPLGGRRRMRAALC
jgi:U3 small nucleolar RNA-associated protein 12